jgi:hypothetical protein
MEPKYQVYYPSLVLNLQIRFDEGKKKLAAGPPKSAADVATAGGNKGPTVKDPTVLKKGTIDNLSKVLGIVPKTATIDLPGYRQAGTFSFVIEFKDLPLDPRVIRAMGVSIYLGAIPSGDWGAGILQYSLEGQRKSILTPSDDPKASNLLIKGVADSIHVEHSSSGHWLTVEGRDLRGLLLDAKIASETLDLVDMSLPIDQVVTKLVSGLSQMTGGVVVKADPVSAWVNAKNGQLPSPGTQDDVTRVNLDAAGQKRVSSAHGNANSQSFWDVITYNCFLVGAIPYFEGSTLWIRPARNLYYWKSQEQHPTGNSPFKGGNARQLTPPDVATATTLPFRRLVFGRNIEHYKIERSLSGYKVPTIECRCVDTTCGVGRGLPMMLRAQHPPLKGNDEARTTNVGPSGESPQTEVMVIPVSGVKTQDQLQHIAEDLYEEIGRQELGGSVTTKSLASFGGDNQDPDLLKLRPGDPIEFQSDASGLEVYPPPIDELLNMDAQSVEGAIKSLGDRLGDSALARQIVEINRNQNANLQQTFRVKDVKFGWDANSGVSIEFDFQNYVEVRAGITQHQE